MKTNMTAFDLRARLVLSTILLAGSTFCLPACGRADDAAASSTESDLTGMTLHPNEIVAGLGWGDTRTIEYWGSRSGVANSYGNDESRRFAAFFFHAAAGDKPRIVVGSPPDAQLTVWLLDSDFNIVPLTQETPVHGPLYREAYYPLYTPFVANLTKSDTYYVVTRDTVIHPVSDLSVALDGDHAGVYGSDYGGVSAGELCVPGSKELDEMCRYGDRCLNNGCYSNRCTNENDTNEKCHADIECATNQSCIDGRCANPRVMCSLGGGSSSSGSGSSTPVPACIGAGGVCALSSDPRPCCTGLECRTNSVGVPGPFGDNAAGPWICRSPGG